MQLIRSPLDQAVFPQNATTRLGAKLVRKRCGMHGRDEVVELNCSSSLPFRARAVEPRLVLPTWGMPPGMTIGSPADVRARRGRRREAGHAPRHQAGAGVATPSCESKACQE